MASVVIRPNESQDNLLRRFRKKVVKSGVEDCLLRFVIGDYYRSHLFSPPFSGDKITSADAIIKPRFHLLSQYCTRKLSRPPFFNTQPRMNGIY